MQLWRVPAETRRVAVPAEIRSATVEHDDGRRVSAGTKERVAVPLEQRRALVPAEVRTAVVPFDSTRAAQATDAGQRP